MRALWMSMPVVVVCLAASARAETDGEPAGEPGAVGSAGAAETAGAVDAVEPAGAVDAAETAGAVDAARRVEADRAAARRKAVALARARRDGGTADVEYGGAPIAVAVSSPVGWLRGTIAGSAYVAPDAHSAIRVNFSRYDAEALLPAILTQFQNATHHGTITDIGISWIWYPRRPWDGFLLEVGVNRRDRDTWVWPEMEDRVDTTSTTYAARGLIGWSWMIGGRVFLAVAVGASAGRETGHDTITPEFPRDRMPTTEAVTRSRVDLESYWRLGIVFGR